MITKKKKKLSSAQAILQKLSGGPLTLAKASSVSSSPRRMACKALARVSGPPLNFCRMAWALQAIRLGEEETLEAFASQLGISRSHLCDIEKGRKAISVARAARFAKDLGYSPEQFVRLTLQNMVQEAGLPLTVKVQAAR